MSVSVVFEGAACIDCVIMLANGDESIFETTEDMQAWSARVDTVALYELGNVVVTGDESYFSSHACGNCGTTLAGDRTDIAVLS
jgi:hypothetical protein